MSMFKKEGNKILFRETGQPVRLFIVEQFGFSHYPNGEMIKFIDAVANNGANGIRVLGFFPFGRGREEEPYRRVGDRFDLSRLNKAYVNYLRQWMAHAQKRGVVVLYELFDSVGAKIPKVAQYHPFGRFNDGDLQAFSDLTNHELITYQKNYVTQIVNVLKQYPNVIFGIMNEFVGDKHWHYEMSRHVKMLAPNHLISGSEEGSPAMGDPNVDIWAIHTGSYDKRNCRPNVGYDVAEWRSHIGEKILTYSTDGFGLSGIPCEKPDAMRNLAQEVKKQNLPIFRFLDHNAYVGFDDDGSEYPVGTWYRNDHVYESARAGRANTETYQAIAEVFPVTPLVQQKPVELPKGFLYVFDATYLKSTHPNAIVEKGGKAVAATKTQGYLCLTPAVTNCPTKQLEVYFNVFIDNNTYNDALILILDVYDAAQKRVLTNWAATRKQFAKTQAFNLLKLSFTPPKNSRLLFRVYYFGYAYIAVNRIAVIDPDQVQIKAPSDIPDIYAPPTPVPSPAPTPEPSPEPETQEGLIDVFDVIKSHSTHPEVFRDRGGKAVLATTTPGFLAYGQYATGYPSKLLDVYFSVFIDNNSADDRRILTLDVYDSFQEKLLTQAFITRKQFPKAGAFNLFKLSFTPVEQSKLEFRIFYNGWSYIAADRIAVVVPGKILLKNHDDILALKRDEPSIPKPKGKIVISESLKDRNSVAQINDGTWTAEGVQLRGGDNCYIRYEIPSIPHGFIEFSARGFIPGELHGGTEYKGLLLSMWDGKAGYDYNNAAFIYELRKYGYIKGRPDASDTLWFKIKSNGEWTENHRSVLSWDREKTYKFRIEWGGGETRVIRDGQPVAQGRYRAEFSPTEHLIQIGANPLRGRKTAHDLLISDVVIGRL